METASIPGNVDRVRLHILSWPTGGDAPTAAWVMELSDVDWRPPAGWQSEIEHTLSDPEDAGGRLTAEVDAGPDGVVLDVVVRTAAGSALVIADRHRAASLLDSWAEPSKSLVANVDHHTSEAAARAAVLLVLESHFGVDAGAVDSVTVEFEPGEEWFVHVRADASQYLGTVSRQGRGQVSHVVHQADANIDPGGAGAV